MNMKNFIPLICIFLALIILGATFWGKKMNFDMKISKPQIAKTKLINQPIKPKKTEVTADDNKQNIINVNELSSKTVKSDDNTAVSIPVKQDKKAAVEKAKAVEIYQLQKENDFKYQNHVLYSIRKNWFKVSKNTDADFSMLIRISQDGNIVSYGILKQSNDKTFQDKAIKSVLESVPYQKFKSDDIKFLTYQVVFRGNDVRMGIYKTDYELPYKVNYKKISASPFDFSKSLVTSTVASAPGKFAYKVPSDMIILRNWNPPFDAPSMVNVGFDIAKNGEITNIKIISSSGDKDAPQAALKALKSAKFGTLPEDVIDVKYWFEVRKFVW